MPDKRITIRLPCNHPIFKLQGNRSERIRNYIDIGIKLELEGSISKLPTVEITSRTSGSVIEERKLEKDTGVSPEIVKPTKNIEVKSTTGELTFDIDAFGDL